MLVNGVIYQRYDIGYNVAKLVNATSNKLPIYGLNLNGVINNLEFHSNHSVYAVSALADIPVNSYYLLVNSNLPRQNLPSAAKEVANYTGVEMQKFIPSLLSERNYRNSIQTNILYLVDTK